MSSQLVPLSGQLVLKQCNIRRKTSSSSPRWFNPHPLRAHHTFIVNWSLCPVNWSSNIILSKEKPAKARRHQFPADLIPTLHSTQCALHISLISKTIHSQLVPLSNKLVIYSIKHWVSLSGSVANISMLHTTFGLFLCCNIMVEIWYDFHACGVQRLPL